MVSEWLHITAIFSLVTGGICALIVLAHVLAHPQKMSIMNVVWPITPLYFGVLGLWAYFAIGVRNAKNAPDMDAHSGHDSKNPSWQSVFTGVSHCGAGCTLGDIVAEFGVFFLGLTLAGAAVWAAFVLDFTLAFLFGIAFQYFAIAPMRGLGVKDGIVAALKADTLSITAYEAGMLVWMALTHFVLWTHPHLEPNQPTYWLMMQIAMIVGFGTSYPMNRWLIKRGLKEAM